MHHLRITLLFTIVGRVSWDLGSRWRSSRNNGRNTSTDRYRQLQHWYRLELWYTVRPMNVIVYTCRSCRCVYSSGISVDNWIMRASISKHNYTRHISRANHSWIMHAHLELEVIIWDCKRFDLSMICVNIALVSGLSTHRIGCQTG